MSDGFEIGIRVKPNEKYWRSFAGTKRNKERIGTITGLSRTKNCRVVKWDDLIEKQTINVSFLERV